MFVRNRSQLFKTRRADNFDYSLKLCFCRCLTVDRRKVLNVLRASRHSKADFPGGANQTTRRFSDFESPHFSTGFPDAQSGPLSQLAKSIENAGYAARRKTGFMQGVKDVVKQACDPSTRNPRYTFEPCTGRIDATSNPAFTCLKRRRFQEL
jgi:hypothetical protein